MCLIVEHAHALERINELLAENADLKSQIASIPGPETRVQVGADYIFNILNQVKPAATYIYISDNRYFLCSKNDVDKFLAQDITNKHKYVAEEFDCDDFSYRLMGQFSIRDWSGIALGIVWTDLHALNCLIDDTGKFYFIEPQSDQLQEELEAWQGNEILFILM
jgi:hypothetical protein